MKGVGKRVTIGFLSIVVLLLISGVISLFELSNLSYDTETILQAGSEDMEVAKRLLRASHDHSRAVLDIAVFNDSTKIEKRDNAIAQIAEQLHSVKSKSHSSLLGCIDTLTLYAEAMERATTSTTPIEKQSTTSDSLQIAQVQPLGGREWYSSVYEPKYNDFIEQTKRYMRLSHGQLAPRAEQLSRNAHRAIAPVLISLLVMIAMVLMLYYFVYIYGVKPIVKINRSLSDYLSFKLPYTVKEQLVDELKELSDNIDSLITSSKSKK